MPTFSKYIWKFPWGDSDIPCNDAENCPIAAKSQEIAAQETQLRQLQNSMNRRRQELDHWKDQLEKEANKLSRWKSSLQSKEQALAAKAAQNTSESRQREQLDAELKKRQQELDDREHALEIRLAALEAASQRYQQEREQWEACQPLRSKPAVSMEEELDAVKKAFMRINTELKETRENLLTLSDTVSRSSRDGVAQLCKLYREMTFAENKQILLLANRLGAILQSEFDAEPLDPRPGDAYDSTCHERIDLSQSGERILCCRARGWRWKEEVLMRAVVDTEERNVR